MTQAKSEKPIIFCPDCLRKMQNGVDPNVYQHAKPNGDCAVLNVELNGDLGIAKIRYVDGFIFKS